MPTTVANLIDYLKTLPQDGIVRVAKEVNCAWDTAVIFKVLELPHDIFIWDRDGQTFVDIGEK